MLQAARTTAASRPPSGEPRPPASRKHAAAARGGVFGAVRGLRARFRPSAVTTAQPRHLLARADHRAIGRRREADPRPRRPPRASSAPALGVAVTAAIEDYWRQPWPRATPCADASQTHRPYHAFKGAPAPDGAARRARWQRLDLWKTSGHFDFYKEGMFDQMEVEGAEYQLQPMNCPFHVRRCVQGRDALVPRLPLRWAELGTVYRYERIGTLARASAARLHAGRRAHLLPARQLRDELVGGSSSSSRCSPRSGSPATKPLAQQPEKAVGSDDIWEKSRRARGRASAARWDYSTDEGGGAFVGRDRPQDPDALGRLWQCSTVQCDFNPPER